MPAVNAIRISDAGRNEEDECDSAQKAIIVQTHTYTYTIIGGVNIFS